MEPLEFDEGRAVVTLPGGRWLSIVNDDRNQMIREAKRWSPSAVLHGWEITDVQAEPGNYEVAVIDAPEDGKSVDDLIDPAWEQYRRYDEGWTIYCNVPLEVITELVDRMNR